VDCTERFKRKEKRGKRKEERGKRKVKGLSPWLFTRSTTENPAQRAYSPLSAFLFPLGLVAAAAINYVYWRMVQPKGIV